MKQLFFISMIALTMKLQAQVMQPTSLKIPTTDVFHGKEINENFRYLEDENSDLTKQWIEEQNRYTSYFTDRVPFKESIRASLTKMWNYEKFGSPFKEGDYYLFYKNNGLQNQSVLYIQKGLAGEPSVFLDPNTLNESGTSSLNAVELSKNQKLCAYSVSNAGSDWQEIYVMDVVTKKLMTDKIEYSKFSGISWKGDEGFYYSGYDKPKNEAEKYSAKTEFQKIFFHKIGTSQSQDKMIYEDTEHPLRYKGVALSEDERWLMMSVSEGTDGGELYYWDLKDNTQNSFKLLSKGFDINQDFVEVVNDQFLIYTNYKAPNYRLVMVNPKSNARSNWKDIVPEKKIKLESVSRVGDKLFCSYLENACSKVDVYSLAGKLEKTIQLPGLGTASGFAGSSKDHTTFYSYTSFNAPTTIYKYDLTTGTSTLFKKPEVKADLENTVVEQRWFASKDGTQIPMFIYHRKDIDIHVGAPKPVLMYGYGGFNISLTPSFSIPMSYFVQQGGVYVVVNLRGGGEFGENWHKGGMLQNKQNVFDDFIGAAEYLIQTGVTNPDKLAIHGRSNGGLLVGACMTQRPDLFRVALPGVGVLDMLRYHKFTVGWGWAVEYGSSDNKEDFDNLLKYSPLHNCIKGTVYPATMITTADHDDRVVPAHSFKFAAALQEANGGENPITIRIDTQAGHGAGKPTSKQIDEWTDILSFTLFYLGVSFD